MLFTHSVGKSKIFPNRVLEEPRARCRTRLIMYYLAAKFFKSKNKKNVIAYSENATLELSRENIIGISTIDWEDYAKYKLVLTHY